MWKKIIGLADKVIFLGYGALFFVTPLIVVPYTSELFEFNKMFFVYAVTVIIMGSWVISSVGRAGCVRKGKKNNKKIREFWDFSPAPRWVRGPALRVRKTPLDIAILLFLASQILATVFSIDRYVSIWGYYSRQNGGLLSTIAYVLLYYAFVSNFSYKSYKSYKTYINRFLLAGLAGGLVVAVYGIAQHFGIDKNLWVQDVQNRVFSTLGQPNWLAAYMGVLSFIAMGLGIEAEYRSYTTYRTYKDFKVFKNYLYFCLVLVFYLAILYTKSRSGLIGFWVGSAVFWSLIGIRQIVRTGHIRRIFVGLYLALFALTFIVGAPVRPLTEKAKSQKHIIDRGNQGTAISRGGTESGEIRKYVWLGAVNAWRANPMLGTGVETFAWAFYKYKPLGHNLTSEWDFLYNKAHNEYLNYLATTGILGLLGYSLIIIAFIVWFIKRSGKWEVGSGKQRWEVGILEVLKKFARSRKIKKSKNQKVTPRGQKHHTSHFSPLNYGLFSAWVSLLITNFFGFSTVVTSLYFWLIPGIAFVIRGNQGNRGHQRDPDKGKVKRLLVGIAVLVSGYLLFTLGRFWYADVLYARGKKLVRSDFANKGEEILKKAARLRPGEPIIWDELGYSKAVLAISAFKRGEAGRASELVREALKDQGRALQTSPQNLNFLKTRVRIYYLFSQMNGEFTKLAVKTLRIARELAPNDPKILYNLALLEASNSESARMERIEANGTDVKKKAIKLVKRALELKPDYRDARVGLGLLYSQDGEIGKAKEQFEYVLEKINPNDEEAAGYLKGIELKN